MECFVSQRRTANKKEKKGQGKGERSDLRIYVGIDGFSRGNDSAHIRTSVFSLIVIRIAIYLHARY